MGIEAILGGVNFVVFSSSEEINSEIYAEFTIKGWQAQLNIPESDEDAAAFLKNNATSSICIIVEQDGSIATKYFDEAVSAGIPFGQIIVGVPSSSLTHKIICKQQGVRSFSFSITNMPTGPKIDIEGLAIETLNAWNAFHGQLLDNEIKKASKSGALAFMSLLFPDSSSDELRERAHIAYALASKSTNSIHFRIRVIRSAMFSNIVFNPKWEQIVLEFNDLFLIRDLLEQKRQYFCMPRKAGAPWPFGIMPELAFSETAAMIQAASRDSTSIDIKQLEYLFSELQLETRISLIHSAKECFAAFVKEENLLRAAG